MKRHLRRNYQSTACLFVAIFCTQLITACGFSKTNNTLKRDTLMTTEQHKTREIYLAGGCFWGTEHFFKQVVGVVATEVGYANGKTKNPTYEQVCTDKTQFAETVHVVYDPEKITLTKLLEIYFEAIDPTSINQQGPDRGSQYRTGVYYTNPDDRSVIQAFFDHKQRHLNDHIAVELQPLKNFYKAEDYHQDYLEKNPNGYCHIPSSLFEYARKANK